MNNLCEAFTKDELLQGLSKKYDYIIIKGDLVEHIYSLMRNQLSDNEMLGFELGSGGSATVMAYIFDSIIDFFSHDKKDKIDKNIEKKLRIYKTKEMSKSHILLRLKQLDY